MSSRLLNLHQSSRDQEPSSTHHRIYCFTAGRYPCAIHCLKTLPLETMVYQYPQQEQAAFTMWYGFATVHMLLLIILYSHFLLVSTTAFGSFRTISRRRLFFPMDLVHRFGRPSPCLIKVHLHCSNWLCDIATLLVQSITLGPFDMQSFFSIHIS